MWGGDHPTLLMDIILPIETKAMPEILDGKHFDAAPDPRDYNHTFSLFSKFGMHGPRKGLRLWMRMRWKYFRDFMINRPVT